MAKVVFRKKAVEDLNDIWTYTFNEWSEEQADKYYEILESACLKIGRNPRIGKSYKEIHTGLLGFGTEKHIIFYQINEIDEIEVIRILHKQMDLKNRILD